MIRASVVSHSDRGLPRATVRVFYSPDGGNEALLREIELALRRQNVTVALGELILSWQGRGLTDLAGTFDTLRVLCRSYEHLGVTIGDPFAERQAGEVLVYSFPIRFGRREPASGGATRIDVTPSWGDPHRQDPWGSPEDRREEPCSGSRVLGR